MIAPLLRLQDAMVHAVGDVHGAIRADRDAVRLRQLHAEQPLVHAGAPLFARASDAVHRAVLDHELADDVVLSVGDEHVAGRVDPDELWPVQLGLQRRSAVTAGAFFAGAGHGANLAVLDDAQRMAAAFKNPDATLPIHLDGARIHQRGLKRWRAVLGLALRAADHGVDDAGLEIDLAYAAVAEVADVQPRPLPIQGDVIRLVELRILRRAAIA